MIPVKQTKNREKHTMKKILFVAAALSLVAPAAFGQADGSGGPMARGGGMAETPIIFLDANDGTPDSVAVGKAVRLELDRSRQLSAVYVDDNSRARLVAPVSVTKDAAGQNMTVTYELRSTRKTIETAQVTCPVAKPATCGRDIVTATEKFMRSSKNR
jgi:hypothetical protein